MDHLDRLLLNGDIKQEDYDKAVAELTTLLVPVPSPLPLQTPRRLADCRR